MDGKTAKKIKDLICQKIEEVARGNSISNSDIEKLNMLIVAYEKQLKIEQMEGIGEYSQSRYSRDGMWNAQGTYARDNHMYDERGNSYGYDGDMSEEGRGIHYVRGHYSKAEASDMTRDHIQRMMSSGNVSEADRRVLERAMEII